MTAVLTIPVLGDNFTYLHPCGHDRALAVDPGNAAPVLRALQEYHLTLAAILTTHHHWDHIGGAADLQSETQCEMIGVDRGLMPATDRTVADGDVLTFEGTRVHVLGTPGHTRTSVCYYIPPSRDQRGVVYTGDTLFVGGCGRLLECDATAMWRSLRRLATLPPDTLVYCGHDYTLENCEFAVTIDPDSRRLRERLAEVQKAVEYGRLTVPSTMAQEKATNLFLLADNPRIQTLLGMPDAPPEEVFAELRRRKDLFG